MEFSKKLKKSPDSFLFLLCFGGDGAPGRLRLHFFLKYYETFNEQQGKLHGVWCKR